MSCDSRWEMLSAYADGEASPDETAIVEAHIAVCVDCARDFGFIRMSSTALVEVPAIEPPTTLRAAIFAATIERKPTPSRFASAIRAAFAPAPVRFGLAAAGALTLAFVAFRNGRGMPIRPAAGGGRPSILASLPISFAHPRAPQPAQTRKSGSRTAPLGAEPDAPTDSGESLPPDAHDSGAATQLAMIRTPPASISLAAKRPRPMKSIIAQKQAKSSEFKVKVATPESSEERPDAADDEVAMNPADTAPVPMEPTVPPTRPTVMASAAGSPAAHFRLAAETASGNPGQIISLADLKRSLRRSNSDSNARFIRESIEQKEIRVGIRGTF